MPQKVNRKVRLNLNFLSHSLATKQAFESISGNWYVCRQTKLNYFIMVSDSKGSATNHKSCNHSYKSFKNLYKSLNLKSLLQKIPYIYCNFSDM